MDRIEGILGAVNDKVQRLLNVDFFYVALRDKITGELTFPLAAEKDDKGKVSVVSWPCRALQVPMLLDSITKRKNSVHLMEPTAKDFVVDGEQDLIDAQLPLAWLAVPMLVEDRVLGVMVAENRHNPEAFGQTGATLLSTVARQTAIAIDNVRKGERLDRKMNALKAVNEIGRELNSRIDLDEAGIIELVDQQVSGLMDTRNMYIALYDDETDEVSFPFMRVNGQPLEVASRRGGHGRTEWIVRNRKPELIATRAESEAWYKQPGRKDYINQPFSSWVGAPMIARNRVIGVIAAYADDREYAYDEDDLEVLQAVAGQAATAFENSRLYEERRRINEELQERTEELRRVNENLEQIVQERTEELRHANEELHRVNENLEQIVQERTEELRRTNEELHHVNENLEQIVQERTEELRRANEELHRVNENLEQIVQERTEELRTTNEELHRVNENLEQIVQERTEELRHTNEELHRINENLEQIVQERTEELRTANEQLREANEELRRTQDLRLMAVLGQVTAGLIHKMSNALGPIPNYWVPTVEECVLPNDEIARKALSRIRDNTSDALTYVEGMNTLLASQKISREETKLEILLRNALRHVLADAEGCAIDVESNLDIIETPVIYVSPSLIGEVFQNITRNAIQAMPDGGSLTVRLEKIDEKTLQITIKDTGIGIPEDKQKNIFTPGFSTKQDGKGLGLWFSKAIVEQHHGDIQFESHEGTGTTFRIVLPIETSYAGIGVS